MGFFFPLIMMLTWMVSVASMVRKLVYEREIQIEEVQGFLVYLGDEEGVRVLEMNHHLGSVPASPLLAFPWTTWLGPGKILMSPKPEFSSNFL